MILITGSSGFVGINVAKYFVDKGTQVTGVDLAKPSKNFPKELFTFHKCDLTDRDAVLKTFEKFNPKSVIHLAFVTHPKDIYGEFLDDVKITLNMLDAACKQRVERFLLMSSSTVYGLKPVDEPVNEEDNKPNPRGAYGKAKLMAELIAKQYVEAKKLPVTIFRGFEIYGPNLTIPSIVRKLLDRAIRKEPMQLYCYGKQKTDFTYVEDLARAMDIALQDPRAIGETFNAGSGKVYTYEEFAKNISQILPAKIELLPPRPSEKPFYLYSDVKKLKALGFTPKYDIKEGLKNTIDWMLTANG
ncbi:MAG TPA: NAD(P)-dependent oxidoreductase [Candidatus Bathyarchaeia archaeon]|nr:NAD(P)-dependent oxidoreductase [Candidatus Bathyarchaeia archaeon]